MDGIGIIKGGRRGGHEDEQSQAKDGDFHLHSTCRHRSEEKFHLAVLRKTIGAPMLLIY